VEQKVGRKLPMVAPYLYEVCGDCTYLDGINCVAEQLKPWDCLAYPLCPFWDVKRKKLIPSFARNCSYPTDIPRDWLSQVWTGWQMIEMFVQEDWLEWYTSIPDYDVQYLSIGEAK
jgi:hypothetical protein